MSLLGKHFNRANSVGKLFSWPLYSSLKLNCEPGALAAVPSIRGKVTLPALRMAEQKARKILDHSGDTMEPSF